MKKVGIDFCKQEQGEKQQSIDQTSLYFGSNHGGSCNIMSNSFMAVVLTLSWMA